MTSVESEFSSRPDRFVSHGNNEELSEIIVDSEKGVEWISVEEDISNEVGGLDLSVSDFMSSGELSGMDDSHMTIETNAPVSYSIMQDLEVIHETCESSSLDEADVETEALTETPEEVPYTKKDSLIHAPKHYRKPSNNSSLKRLLKAAPTPSTSESNNSDSSIQSYTSLTGKRKVGWPKGRKRKPDLPYVKPPKAPNTGYVLYLTEKRKHYKHLPFHEVTKLLGNEWTKLDNSEKKVYLEKAEIDKKRYREELRVYRKSDAYQTYLKWKRSKRRHLNGTEESDIDATDEIDEEDNEELYCKYCDQWFVTFHNKKEHLAGKQHWAMVSSTRKHFPETGHSNGSSSQSFDDSSLEAPAQVSSSHCDLADAHSDQPTELEAPDSPNVEDNIVEVMKKFAEREEEIKYLRSRLAATQEKHNSLKSQVSNLKCRKAQLSKTVSRLKNEERSHRPCLLKYWNIISFFVPSNGYDETSSPAPP